MSNDRLSSQLLSFSLSQPGSFFALLLSILHTLQRMHNSHKHVGIAFANKSQNNKNTLIWGLLANDVTPIIRPDGDPHVEDIIIADTVLFIRCEFLCYRGFSFLCYRKMNTGPPGSYKYLVLVLMYLYIWYMSHVNYKNLTTSVEIRRGFP